MSRHILIDFLSKNESHLNFNLSYIKAYSSNEKKFQIIGNQSHIEKLNLNKDCLIGIKNDNSKWFFRVIKLFLKLILKHEKIITVLAFENYVFPILLILFFPLFWKKKFVLVVHNNIPALINSKFKRLPLQLANKLVNLNFICMTMKGKEAMDKLGFNNSCLIPHMNFTHIYITKTSVYNFNSNKINIVVLGRQAKIFTKFIAPSLEENKNVLFHVFGVKMPSNSFIKYYESKPSSEKYQAILKSADYCFFPNINIGYQPSGILLDALSNNCPIIAPNESHYSEFSDFNVGLFYSELSDIYKINNTRDKFDSNEFNKANKKTSIENFSHKLSKIYSSL